MKLLKYIFAAGFCFIVLYSGAQNFVSPYFKGAIRQNRVSAYHNIVDNIIIKNLSLPLTDSTEEDWEDAFDAMEITQYKSQWVNQCVYHAFDSIEKRSVDFQEALMQLSYANYLNKFTVAVSRLLEKTNSEKIFAVCTEYLKRSDSSDETDNYINAILRLHIKNDGWNQEKDSILIILNNRFSQQQMAAEKILTSLFSNSFLKNNIVVFSIQRKNRDYPGIAIVRNANGNFIKNNDSSLFYVPQLARSISNLPSYITNGNTPQGIFKMDGFAISGANYIGPTQNIQLTMPFETSIAHFLNDTKITDTTWTEKLYATLLPADLKDYTSLYGTYIAGQLGRTEIIAHGTTIDPDYYKDKLYYPQTPTQGCLCTQEIWSPTDGKRLESDQLLLNNAVKKAGGPTGYYVVIEIDDAQKPVALDDILPFIK